MSNSQALQLTMKYTGGTTQFYNDDDDDDDFWLLPRRTV